MRPHLRTSLKATLGLLGALGLLVVGAAPGSTQTAASGPIGYVTVGAPGSCQLQKIDLTTGVLTDLPAAPSADACVGDLAMTSDGTVWGVLDGTGPQNQVGSFTPQAAADPSLVRFSADGTPNLTQITVPDSTIAFLRDGGIAVSTAGTVYVQIASNAPGCLPQVTDTTSTSVPTPQQVCLYTVDPSTGAATLVGPTDTITTYFDFLTTCSSGAYTVLQGQGPELSTESLSTGHASSGPVLDSPIGIDCSPGTGTLYAVNGVNTRTLASQSRPAAIQQTEVGTIDPSTGAFTAAAPVSDQRAEIWALAVAPTPVPPTTTPTTSGGVAPAVEVPPAFTG